jgi:Flp pilus assembly protein TadB
VLVPPLVFAAEVVLVLALAAAAAAVYLGLPAADLGPRLRRALRPYLRRQRDIAQGLGMSTRSWVALRVGAALAGFGIGALSGIPTVAVGSLALGLVGVPWLLAGRAAQRRLRMERALAGLLVELRNLMQQSNLALDRALREAARNPAPELSQVLAPLAGDDPIGESLAAVGSRAGSPLADLVVTALLIARTHSPVALVRVIEEVLIPVLGVTVEVQEENHATVAQQRAAAVAIGIIMLVLFAAVVRVPSMHAFYDSPPGQLVLLLVATMYAALVWLIGRIARPVPWVEWDLEAVRRETEALLV